MMSYVLLLVFGWIASGLIPAILILLSLFYIDKEHIMVYDIKNTILASLMGPIFLILFIIAWFSENIPSDHTVVFRNKRKK